MSNYNKTPAHLWEITRDEFMRDMFHHTWKQESRQVFDQPGRPFSLRMFNIYEKDSIKLGIAIMQETTDCVGGTKLFSSTTRFYRYCRYGSEGDWLNFRRAFAAQFAGDNS